MSSATSRSPFSRRALIAIVATAVAAAERAFYMGRPAANTAYAVAQGWLWVDGVRVYHATDLAMRIVSGAAAQS